MHIPIPSPEILAIAGAIFGQVGHIVKKHESEDGSQWGTIKRWVFGKFWTTGLSMGVNAGLVLATPLPTVESLAGAAALFLTYVGQGVGCNSMLNAPGEQQASG